jgi:adenylate cyclase
MCEIIYRHGGTVDKFMGDAIMALFGAPCARPKDIERAICCAVEMQIAMDRLNRENEALGLPNLYMGIGINTGDVIAGKIGSELHSEYTVIGDEVNLASRIEAFALRGQILISEKTYQRTRKLVFVKKPVLVSVKGKEGPVSLYELKGVGTPYSLEVPEREARRSIRVDVDVPIVIQLCEGKMVKPETYKARILNIGYGGLLASTSAKMLPHKTIRFRLNVQVLGIESGDIYGRILRVTKKGALFEISVEFTALTPSDQNAIKQMIDRILQGHF